MIPVDETDTIDKNEFNSCYLNNKPLIIRNAAKSWPAFQWSFESLGKVYGNTVITIESYDGGRESYWKQINRKKRTLCFKKFLNELQHSPDPNWSLRENYDIFSDHPELKKDFQVEQLFPGIDKEWFYYLWCGPEGYLTGLHADDLECNFLVQVLGEKIFKLFCPDDSEFLYPESETLMTDGAFYSLVNPFNPDPERFPAATKATEYEALVGPGDIIYIPGLWWHAVKSLSPVISVNICYGENESELNKKEMLERRAP